MLADFFTKALTGKLFWRFRDVLMVYKPITTLYDIQPFPVKDHVGDLTLVKNKIVTEKLQNNSKSKKKILTWVDKVRGYTKKDLVKSKE